jgi:hypothetical protein
MRTLGQKYSHTKKDTKFTMIVKSRFECPPELATAFSSNERNKKRRNYNTSHNKEYTMPC